MYAQPMYAPLLSVSRRTRSTPFTSRVEAMAGGFTMERDASITAPGGVVGVTATVDPTLPLALGRECAEHLERMGYRVEWHEYPMAHGVCPPEIDAISAWLVGVYAGVETVSNE